MTPTIVTDRLVLRAPARADFDSFAETLTSPRARHIGGPFSRADAWREFAADAGAWVLNGFGYWSVEERRTGALVASVGLSQPIEFPEPELGWVVHGAHEGNGFAFEAAIAARRYAFEDLGWATLVSYIAPENTRSIALAERLGAWRDPSALGPSPTEIVFRHPQQIGKSNVGDGVAA